MTDLHICPLNPEAHDAETCPGKKGEIREGKIEPITPDKLRLGKPDVSGEDEEGSGRGRAVKGAEFPPPPPQGIGRIEAAVIFTPEGSLVVHPSGEDDEC